MERSVSSSGNSQNRGQPRVGNGKATEWRTARDTATSSQADICVPWAAQSRRAGSSVQRRSGREAGGKAALEDARQSAKNRQTDSATALAAALLALPG